MYTVSDAGNPGDREALLEWVKTNHPDCNAIINNAGIQVGAAVVAFAGLRRGWRLSCVFW